MKKNKSNSNNWFNNADLYVRALVYANCQPIIRVRISAQILIELASENVNDVYV